MTPQDMFSTVDNAVKLVIANKVDKAAEREVPREQGSAFARQHGTLFVETSAKANTAVSQVRRQLSSHLKVLLDRVGTPIVTTSAQTTTERL